MEFFNEYQFPENNRIEERHEEVLAIYNVFQEQMDNAESIQVTGMFEWLRWARNLSPYLLSKHYETTGAKEEIYLKAAAEEIQELYVASDALSLVHTIAQITHPMHQVQTPIELNLTDKDEQPIVKSIITNPIFRKYPHILKEALSKIPEKRVERFLKEFEGEKKLSPNLPFGYAQALNPMTLFHTNGERKFPKKESARGFIETKVKGIFISHFYENTHPSTLPHLSVLVKPLK